MDEKIKYGISIIAFISAVVIGFIALFIPPQGIIDASVLWFTAQLLVFVSGLLGFNLELDLLKRKGQSKQYPPMPRQNEKAM